MPHVSSIDSCFVIKWAFGLFDCQLTWWFENTHVSFAMCDQMLSSLNAMCDQIQGSLNAMCDQMLGSLNAMCHY